MKRLIIFSILFLLPLYAHSDEVMQYYMNDNAASTVVIDSSASATDGTLAGGDNTSVLAGTGKVRGCLNFNGSDDVVDTGQTLQTTLRDSFSVSMWVRPDDGHPATAPTIVGSYLGANTDSVFIKNETGGYVSFYYTSDGDSGTKAQTTDRIFVDGQAAWHHVVCVADSTIGGAGGKVIYIDGVLAALSSDGSTAGVTFADFTTTENIYVGALNVNGGATQFFAGDIDDVRILNTALTANEVTKLYYNGRGTETALADIVVTDEVAHFKMNDNAADTVVTDSSDPIGNDGVLAGGDVTATITEAGQILTALNMNGTDDYVDMGRPYQEEFRKDFSVALWVKPDDGQPASTEGLFGVDDTTGVDSAVIMFNATDGKVTYYYESEGETVSGATSAAVFSDGAETWHHLVLTVTETSGTTVAVNGYFDGSIAITEATGTATMGNFTTAINVWFPGWHSTAGLSSPFAGGVDDVRIYTEVLSAGEVSAIYEGGRGTEGSLNHATVGSGIGIKCGASAGSN